MPDGNWTPLSKNQYYGVMTGRPTGPNKHLAAALSPATFFCKQQSHGGDLQHLNNGEWEIPFF
jgi:hypothetical protein